jgi:Flp pilus assembly protein TadD
MGRTRNRSTKFRAKQIVEAPSNEPPSIPALLAKAQDLLTQCDYALALRFIQRILENDPGNSQALEMKGFAEIETGDTDSARQVSHPPEPLPECCPVTPL